MPSLAEIREGIATNLGAIPELQASAYILSNPTTPAAWVMPSVVEYDKAFRRGFDQWRLTVRVLVGTPSDIGAQKRLDRMIAPSGPESVKATVESDRTLGGNVNDLRVTKNTGYGLFPLDSGSPVLGTEFEIEVWAEGST